jgi:Uma2 family endonuclease
MRLMKPKIPATIDDLLRMPKDGRKYELVDGEIVVSPAGMRHSEVAAKIGYIIATFLENSPVGKVYSADVGILLPNRNLRSPDVTFVRNEKLPAGKSPESFGEIVPDLAVEVLSPSDSLAQVGRKIGEYLECGVPVVWLVDPRRETVTVYRSLSQTQALGADDAVEAEPVLPGFSCPISRFFQ